QCGWDVSRNAPPTTDPGDTKARLGVAAGKVVVYVVMCTLISGTPTPASAEPARAPQYVDAPQVAPERAYQPVSSPATAIGTPPPEVASTPDASTSPEALISIKVADTKKATIPARDALQYVFGLPDTDQKCRLVGTTKGIGGFGGNIEGFLLSDADYVFWNPNPAGIRPPRRRFRRHNGRLTGEPRTRSTTSCVRPGLTTSSCRTRCRQLRRRSR